MTSITLEWDKRKWDESALDMQGFLFKIGQEVVSNMRESFGSGPPGRQYRRGSVVHIASSTGHPPNVDTGNLSNSLRAEVDVPHVDIYGAEYALYLDDSAQLNRPFISESFDQLDLDDIAGGSLLRGNRGNR